MGYEIKPAKKVQTVKQKGYIGKINANMSKLERIGKRIKRSRDVHDNPLIGHHYNQVRKQVSIITGKPYISHWLRKENK